MPDDFDETDAIPTSSPSTGWMLADRYRVVDRIGAGGMADVFRAHDELLKRDVAVKVFRSGFGDAGDTAGVARQALELQSLARLNHPNLITLYDGSMTAEPTYLVMELVEGQDLAERLKDGALPADEVREIGAQIAGALAYVHAQGLAHRDVKPANILLGTDGEHISGTSVRARLSDFGIVRLIDSPRMTSPELTVGTASYLAPEQARGGDVGTPADVYSLGLVLIESLTGARSFGGPMLEAMAARLSRPPHIPPDLPPPWPQLLQAMTAMDPAARPTASQVAQSLRGTGTQPLAAPPVLPLDPASATTSYLAAAPAAYSPSSTSILPPMAAAAAAAPRPVASASRPLEPERRTPSAWRAALITLALLALVGLVIFLLLSNANDGPTPAQTPTPTKSVSSSAKSTQPSTRAPSRTSQQQTPTPTPSTSSTSSSASSSSKAKPSKTKASKSKTSKAPASLSTSSSPAG